MMNPRSWRRSGLALLLMISAGAVAAQTRTNPTVKVRPGAVAPVPAECEEGLAPQPVMPRADLQDFVQERDRAADMLPPPSRDLRSHLAAAQEAARNNNREAFRQSLAAAKAMLATYPPGGERNAANEAIVVYDDLDRLWDYQYSSPVGAFFDASVQGGNLLAMLQKYRGYDEAVRRQIYVDANGTRLYPTSESRAFLAREADSRLTRLGLRPPPATATTATRPRPTVAETQPRTPSTTTAAKPRVDATPATVTKPRKAAARTAGATPRKSVSPRRSTKRAAVKVDPIAPAPDESQPPDPVPGQSIVATTTITEVPPPTATTEAPPPSVPATAASETVATDTTPISTTPTDSGVASTTVSDPEDAVAQRGRTQSRSVVLPIILILIGVGVLFVLFRASS